MSIEGLRVCKLISGEFVIGRLVGMNLINFFTIIFNVNKLNGQLTNTLSPYMAPIEYSLSHVIDISKIMAITTPTVELVQLYVTTVTEYIQAQQQHQLNEKKDGSDTISGGTDTPQTESVVE